MRLIDSDELIKDRVSNDPVVIAAKCAPTAYDVDKVLGQLEILLEKEIALIRRHVSDASYMAAVIGHTMLVDAVEVVRTGGTVLKLTSPEA